MEDFPDAWLFRPPHDLRGIEQLLEHDLGQHRLKRLANHMTKANAGKLGKCHQCLEKDCDLVNFKVRILVCGDKSRQFNLVTCGDCLAKFEDFMQARTAGKAQAYDDGWEITCDYCGNDDCSPSPHIKLPSLQLGRRGLPVPGTALDGISLIQCETCKQGERRY